MVTALSAQDGHPRTYGPRQAQPRTRREAPARSPSTTCDLDGPGHAARCLPDPRPGDPAPRLRRAPDDPARASSSAQRLARPLPLRFLPSVTAQPLKTRADNRVTRIIAAGIPEVVGTPCQLLARRAAPGRIRQAPPSMRWRGTGRPRRTGQLCGLAGPARRPPGPGTRARNRSPGFSHVPGSPSGGYPFPTARHFCCIAGRTARARGSHFGFLRYPRRNAQEVPSYPHFTAVINGFIHSLSSAWRCEPENTRSADTGRNRLIFHIGWREIIRATGFDAGTR